MISAGLPCLQQRAILQANADCVSSEKKDLSLIASHVDQ
jgi:hypothetical protein